MNDWYQTWKRKVNRVRAQQSWRQPAFWRHELSRVKVWRNLALAALGAVVFGTMLFTALFAWYAKDLPRPDKVVRQTGFTTKILDRNGVDLYDIYTDKERTPITVDQIPDDLKKAVVSIEDKNFYKHGGFDKESYLRIIWDLVTKRRLIGGSTLTQQLVKNSLLTTDRTLIRKMKELILAVQIENRYNKDQIMQMYLNEAPYGGTLWGVGTAAEAYFSKPVTELNLIECAILAGLPQRPSYFSPSVGDNYKPRTRDVLRRMREEGYITKDQENQALKDLDALVIKPQLTGIKAPHFTMYVKDQLEQMFGQALVEQGGLTVTTALDYEMQQKVQRTVTEEVAKSVSLGVGNGAAMVMDPATGQIWSMVGSKDFFAKDYDGQVNVTLALRQPGSSIKPVTYAAAFSKGFTPATVLMDVPTQFPGATPDKPYAPVNYDGKFRGPVQLRFALGSSLNIPAVKLLALVGMQNMMQLADDMGITTLAPTQGNLSRFGLSLTLGGGEVRLIDMTTAYSAFANGGTRVDPVSILKVEDRNGKVLYEDKPVQGKRVLDEGVTFLINHVLTDNNARLLEFGANSYLNMNGRPIAVKTGTTNDKRDNWTIGWSNSAVVGVWVGNNDNTPMKNVASGVTGAAPIWRKIMLEVLTKHPATDWKIPDDVQAVIVDTISGYPEHDGFSSRAEYVIKNTLPPLPDPIHRMVQVCKGQNNKLASAIDVENNNFDLKEFITPIENKQLGNLPSWKDQNRAWAQSQGDEKYKLPTDSCGSVNDSLVRISGPGDHSNYNSDDVHVKVMVLASKTVSRVELFVDGNGKGGAIVEQPYEWTLTKDDLTAGKHTLRAKATFSDNSTGDSSDVHIGYGGVPWDQADPTPTPLPAGGPSPTPAATSQ